LCHSTSISKGDWFNNKGFRAELITAADISGGSKPWQKASPQPESPSLVFISTSVAERLFTQPWEKAKGTSNSDFIIDRSNSKTTGQTKTQENSTIELLNCAIALNKVIKKEKNEMNHELKMALLNWLSDYWVSMFCSFFV